MALIIAVLMALMVLALIDGLASQFTSTLDLLEHFLGIRGHKFCRLDGSTNRVQRQVDINAFNMVRPIGLEPFMTTHSSDRARSDNRSATRPLSLRGACFASYR